MSKLVIIKITKNTASNIVENGSNRQKKQKEPGHYVGLGVALGVSIGVALGTSMDNISVGIAIGTGIGIAMGSAFEQRAKERGEIRELTEEEKLKNKRHEKYVAMALGALILVGAVIAIIVIY